MKMLGMKMLLLDMVYIKMLLLDMVCPPVVLPSPPRLRFFSQKTPPLTLQGANYAGCSVNKYNSRPLH